MVNGFFSKPEKLRSTLHGALEHVIEKLLCITAVNPDKRVIEESLKREASILC